MRRADLIGGVLLLAFGLLFTFIILPTQTGSGRWSGLSPIFFPSIVGLFLIGSCVLLLVQAIFAGSTYDDRPKPVTVRQVLNTVLALAIILSCILAMERFGFFYGAIPLVLGIMLYMGERNWLRLILLPAVCPYLIYLFLTQVMRMPLP